MRTSSLPLVLLAFLLALPSTAFALDDDVFSPFVIATWRHDSNTFRLPSDASERSGQGGGTTRTEGVGLDIDKTYGLQRLVLDGELKRYQYSNDRALDATAETLDATFSWSATPSVGGKLIYIRRKLPSSFADVGFQTTANLRTTELKRADLSLRPGAAVYPVFTFFENSARTEHPTFQQEDFTSRSVMASLVYAFASGNTVEAYVRRANGDYHDVTAIDSQLLASAFHEVESGVRMRYESSGLSTFIAEAGYLQRTHPGVDERDFSGAIARLDYRYQATGKLRLELFASRQLYSSQTNISSYVSQQDVGAAVAWDATGKVTVRPSFRFQRRDFDGSPFASSQSLREDTRSSLLDVTWRALRSLNLSATAGRDVRRATLPQYNYVNNSFMLAGQLRF